MPATRTRSPTSRSDHAPVSPGLCAVLASAFESAVRLADRAWPDIDRSAILVVPVGSTEQHGPHLPLSTDLDVASAVAERVAAQRADLLVAPALPYGASGEHQSFPGTLSIGHEALTQVLVELARSATETFRRVLFVNGHGGNVVTLGAAEAQLRAESRDVRAWTVYWIGDAHAGRSETSLQLALTPHRVGPSRERGNVSTISELLPMLRTGGVAAVSPNGVLGDPAGASAAEGVDLLDVMVADLLDHLTRWWP